MAKWTTTNAEVTMTQKADGSFEGSVPLNADGVRQGMFYFTMSANRALRIEWVAEPNAPGLTDFQAWSKVSGT